MRDVLVVTDQADGVSARDLADALAGAWRRRHPDDRVRALPVSDGGPGLLDAVANPEDTWLVTEVAGPLGHPVEAALLLRPDGDAVVEAARAAAPGLAPEGVAPVVRATTYGVGQLLDAAREAGARRIHVGVGGVAAVDGGTGALTGLGYALRVADGSGLKIGADDLARIDGIATGWAHDFSGVEVVVLADTARPLAEATATAPAGVRFDAGDEERVARGLDALVQVAARDLGAGPLARRPGTGAGGGLAFGLAAALHGTLRPAVEGVWALQRGPDPLEPDTLVLVAAPDGAAAGHASRLAAAAGARCIRVPLPAEAGTSAALPELADRALASLP